MLNKKGKIAVAILIMIVLLILISFWFFFFGKINITGNFIEKTGQDCFKDGKNNTKIMGIAKINRAEYSDKCINTSSLKEYYCGNNSENLYYDIINCDCREGKCVPNVDCVEDKNKLLKIYEKAQIKYQFQDSCISRGNKSILVKYRCENFISYDTEEQVVNRNYVEDMIKSEEPCYLNDQYCDPYTLECKYRLGVNTEPKLSVFPNQFNLEENKSVTITLIDITIPREKRIVDILVNSGGRSIEKAVYYESDGLYKAKYNFISDECLKDVIHPCDPKAMPVSSGNVMIYYRSNTGKVYSTSFNIIAPAKQVSLLLSQPSPEPVIPETMTLEELKIALEKVNKIEQQFILKGAENIAEQTFDFGKSVEAQKFNNNFFGLKLLQFSDGAKNECDIICKRVSNSTMIFDQNIHFNNLINSQLETNDMCSCRCVSPSSDIALNCEEIVRRGIRKAYNATKINAS